MSATGGSTTLTSRKRVACGCGWLWFGGLHHYSSVQCDLHWGGGDILLSLPTLLMPVRRPAGLDWSAMVPVGGL